MNINNLFPRRYAVGADIKAPTKVTIKSVTVEQIQTAKGKVEKPVIWFMEIPKGIFMNRTIASQIATFLGDDCDTWTGKAIVVYPVPCQVAGVPRVAIRVKQPQSMQS